MDAIYILSPEAHVVECLLADFQSRRYRRSYLVWTGLLDPQLRRKIDDFPGVRQLRASSNTLFADFYPREGQLVTFRDPWSFPLLYHPACNALVPKHMQILAQRVWRVSRKPWGLDADRTSSNRLQVFVSHSASTRKSDTTDRPMRSTRPPCCVAI
jgi:hypothetical protein